MEDADPGTPWKTDVRPHAERFENYRIGGWIATGVGAAAVLTGTILLVVDALANKDDHVDVAATVSPHGLGLSWRGVF